MLEIQLFRRLYESALILEITETVKCVPQGYEMNCLPALFLSFLDTRVFARQLTLKQWVSKSMVEGGSTEPCWKCYQPAHPDLWSQALGVGPAI